MVNFLELRRLEIPDVIFSDICINNLGGWMA